MSLEKCRPFHPFAIVDIVFVPAIGAHHRACWLQTATANDRLDIVISKALGPTVQTYLYDHYDAKERSGVKKFKNGKLISDPGLHDTSEKTMGQYGFDEWAKRLARTVAGHRVTTNTTGHTLIFICHSTGGLVVKHALNVHLEDNSLKKACIHVAFFCTPHRGSKIVCKDEYVSTIQQELMMNHGLPKHIRQKLEPGTAYLRDMHQVFLRSAIATQVANFHEQLESTLCTRRIERNPAPPETARELVVSDDESAFEKFGMPVEDVLDQHLLATHGACPGFGNEGNVQCSLRDRFISFLRGSVETFDTSKGKMTLKHLRQDVLKRITAGIFHVGYIEPTESHRVMGASKLHVVSGAFPCLEEVFSKGPRTCLETYGSDIPELGDAHTRSEASFVPAHPQLHIAQHKAPLTRIHIPSNNVRWLHAVCKRLCDEKNLARLTVKLTNDWRDPIDLRSLFQHPKPSLTVLWPWQEVDESIPPFHRPSPTNDFQMAICIPYLHWDDYNTMKRRTTVREQLDSGCPVEPVDRRVFHSYDLEEKILWCDTQDMQPRRTLFNSSYPGAAGHGDRDKNQVLYKHTYQPDTKSGSVLMVEQLWLFVVDREHIVTCCTPKSLTRASDNFDVYIHMTLNFTYQLSERTDVFDHAARILADTIQTLLTQSPAAEFDVFAIYDESIRKWTEKKTQMYLDFSDDDRLRRILVIGPGEGDDLQAIEELRTIELALVELEDVRDELSIFDELLAKQLKLIEEICAAYTEINKLRQMGKRGSQTLDDLVRLLIDYRKRTDAIAKTMLAYTITVSLVVITVALSLAFNQNLRISVLRFWKRFEPSKEELEKAASKPMATRMYTLSIDSMRRVLKSKLLHGHEWLRSLRKKKKQDERLEIC